MREKEVAITEGNMEQNDDDEVPATATQLTPGQLADLQQHQQALQRFGGQMPQRGSNAIILPGQRSAPRGAYGPSRPHRKSDEGYVQSTGFVLKTERSSQPASVRLVTHRSYWRDA